MKQDQFVDRHEKEWQELEGFLAVQRKGAKATASERAATFSTALFTDRYRRACQQLSLARMRGYSPALVARLQRLVHRSHSILYRTPRLKLLAPLRWLGRGFPQLVRTHGRAMLLSAALLFLPMIAMIIALHVDPVLVHSVFQPYQVAEFEEMYDPARHAERMARGSESDLQMFGFYVMNNASIGFRTFASGLLAGIGTLFVLLMNGVIIGGVAGHLTAIGSGMPFWSFVAGHSAPELLAIVIAGGAGLQLGLALLAPGRLPRTVALRRAGRDGAMLSMGVFAMLVFAAFVEAYWSSITWMPLTIKFAAGGFLWILVLSWLVLAGRRDAH